MGRETNLDRAREWVLDHEQTPYTEDIEALARLLDEAEARGREAERELHEYDYADGQLAMADEVADELAALRAVAEAAAMAWPLIDRNLTGQLAVEAMRKSLAAYDALRKEDGDG